MFWKANDRVTNFCRNKNTERAYMMLGELIVGIEIKLGLYGAHWMIELIHMRIVLVSSVIQ